MAKYIGIKAILNEFKKRILLLEHPVHSLYMSTDPTSPETLFGGKWDSLPAGCFVRNAGGDAGTVGQQQGEGLPNITGSFASDNYGQGGTISSASGAFSGSNWSSVHQSYTIGNPGNRYVTADFNAWNSNHIYGSSDHVTPYNVAVYMWWRTR